jgi:hypothetical protein
MAPSRADIESFDSVYYFNKKCEYPRDVASEIYRGRRELKDKLFFDRLLETIGVNGTQ